MAGREVREVVVRGGLDGILGLLRSNLKGLFGRLQGWGVDVTISRQGLAHRHLGTLKEKGLKAGELGEADFLPKDHQ